MNRIAENVINLANEVVGKTILPQNNNVLMFSVLAGITVRNVDNGSVTVLSLATGTKCIGYATAMKYRKGSILFDSHAEVLARRAFIYYLFKLLIAIKKDPNIMGVDDCIGME